MTDNSIFNDKKVAFHTLGCKLNFAETSAIGRQLAAAGFARVRAGEQADVCVVNTCSVTDVADRKCRQAITKLKRLYPAAIMIVTGCYAQLNPEEIAQIEGVDLVLGANEKFDLLKYLDAFSEGEEKIRCADILKVKEFYPSCSHADRTRTFLKIQDGCDYYCTYCTIPLARGHSRSGTVLQTLRAAENAIAEGSKEIILTGVNIGEFGKAAGETFFDLIKALDGIEAEVRFRISSIEPNLLTDEIIGFVAQSKHFAPHFHIPLQSGSNEVLKLMKRRYRRELFAEKVQKIKQTMPNAFIGVDVIVGVRGETDEYFDESVDFLKSLDISQLHVFTYSEREGTKMLEIDHSVSPKEKKRRSEILHLLSEEKTRAFYQSQWGSTVSVLWESKRAGDEMHGFSENYLQISQKYDKAKINTIEKVVVAATND
ncbi:MAG: tRNA (N(6)-L-threonylcarbamoyladenosine(37)-C(2))-methylthiotransferase MtaB [Prevotellaceae bacterium]|nr:tRNA (N(6)-L-threonylcarbamoyladenosine(37)-C(2))-methylthiotransferase MtaB [Prevotellaceae bacterium]